MTDVSYYQQQIGVCKSNKSALKDLLNYINAQASFYDENHRNIKNIKSTDSDFKGKNADKTANYIEDLQSASAKYLTELDDMKAEISRLINAQTQSINGYKSLIKAEENKELYNRP
ncbi:hypothetical protein HCJ58_10055 [Listeria sp. FSL L7-1509]|uniref:Uncharacterized protein n=1 Tax=Listeria immobilis TaxID=2713502 RepID=A0ABR6SY80_9LIST|nr:hypothetical protein [Listeria immobilis]MBC1481926.1 hypothetical protein [Listeria immobilis]MBC1507301.1 hypothetical protein [Listeria immobilis]MBC1510633.1 hypothetical protein [Listeria immobilis]MBC6301787.1 hypothetical protein [Listeria immobilis]MBC6313161.1 hypothetical protein [Listeria immobilis]